MEINKTITPPAKTMARLYSVHLGKIFSNLSIVFVVIGLASLVTVIATGLMFLFGLILIIMSLGTVFLYIPNYFDMLLSGTEFMGGVAGFLNQFWPVFTPLAIVLAGVSIVLLAMDKHERHTGRIVLSSIIVGIAVLTLILLIAGVGVN